MAALLWAGVGAVLSHITAVFLWKLLPEDGDLDCHITTTSRSGHRPPGIEVHRVRSLSPSFVDRRSRLPLTTVPRTLIDLAETHPPYKVRRALGEALYHRRTSVQDIQAAIDASPGRRGLKTLRRMLPTAAPTHSGVEDRFLPLLAQAGIERPLVNVRVAGWEVDLFWPRQRVVVELDTWWSHGDHLSFEDDRRKAAALARAGCVVLRFTQEQIEDEPHNVLLTIAVTLRDRT